MPDGRPVHPLVIRFLEWMMVRPSRLSHKQRGTYREGGDRGRRRASLGPAPPPLIVNESPSVRIVEIVYTWEDGREEVWYRRVEGTSEAEDLIRRVEKKQLDAKIKGYESPYSYRLVSG